MPLSVCTSPAVNGRRPLSRCRPIRAKWPLREERFPPRHSQSDLTVEFVEEQAGLEKIAAEHRAGGGDPAKRHRRKGQWRRIEGAPLSLIGVLERGILEGADRGQHIRLRHRRIERNDQRRRAVKLLRQQMERPLQGAVLDDTVVERR
jgi:hypothetical protein